MRYVESKFPPMCPRCDSPLIKATPPSGLGWYECERCDWHGRDYTPSLFKRLVHWYRWTRYGMQYRRYRAEAWAAHCTAMSFEMWLKESKAE
jgi:hypothetical protein